MRLLLLAGLAFAACQHQPVFIADIQDAKVRACMPGIGWERDRVLAECGPPDYQAAPPPGDLAVCDVYRTRAVARHQSGSTVAVTQFETSEVAVCFEERTVTSGGGSLWTTDTGTPKTTTAVHRVKAIYTFRAE